MSSLSVTYSKLEKYCKEQGSYDLFKDGDRILLTFVPTFPEAVEKGDSIPPKITMIGKLSGEKVHFTRVEVDDSSGKRTRDQEESKLVYQSWLDFIENNY